MPFNHNHKQSYFQDASDVGRAFKYSDQNGVLKSAKLDCTLFSETYILPTHYVSCRHPEGKVWESLYIPGQGVTGLSVTWWARNGSANGSINVKPVTELEWYNTVKSKAVLKGYEVIHMTGTPTPLNTKHSFVYDLNNQNILVPHLAMPRSQARTLSETEQLHVVATSYRTYKPIQLFLAKLAVKGRIATIKDMLNPSSLWAEHILKLAIEGISEGVPDDAETIKVVIETREDRYGAAWGSFG